jgi:hypothetical protein
MPLSNPRTDPAPASDAAFTPRRCPRCEYNLYGLAPLTACPECGWDPEEAAIAAAAPADAPWPRSAEAFGAYGSAKCRAFD